MDMVSTFDIDVLKGRSFALFPLTHVDPTLSLKNWKRSLTKKRSGRVRILPFCRHRRMNAVMAITQQARYLRDIESWITRLDRANTATGGGVNVYKVQHVDAVELADTLNDIFGGGQRSDKLQSLRQGKSCTVSNKQAR